MDHSVDLSGSLVCERERERNWNMLEIKNENDPTKCAILDKEKIKEKLGTTQLKKAGGWTLWLRLGPWPSPAKPSKTRYNSH